MHFADVRGSVPELVQAVGRALRMQPCEGKTASLVVPVLLGTGETPDNRLTSKPFAGLARLREPSAHTTPASTSLPPSSKLPTLLPRPRVRQ
ncbi:hypothetical protein ACFCW6_06540 [Streptomyces sp. NPDC056333]|uniref:hypothetical protein n=1 Tax=Streptomyces sp. NPDC056333 TaxID=3345786 RepID=UPI0035DDEA4D